MGIEWTFGKERMEGDFIGKWVNSKCRNWSFVIMGNCSYGVEEDFI